MERLFHFDQTFFFKSQVVPNLSPSVSEASIILEDPTNQPIEEQDPSNRPIVEAETSGWMAASACHKPAAASQNEKVTLI